MVDCLLTRVTDAYECTQDMNYVVCMRVDTLCENCCLLTFAISFAPDERIFKSAGMLQMGIS